MDYGIDGERAGRLLVSIITPVRNGRRYLEECLQSVLSQGYPHIEHILVDGVSTDGTLEILARYQEAYPLRVRFISEPDRTPEDAWNKGLLLARGEIMGFLGSDDRYLPEAVGRIVEFFGSQPQCVFVFGGIHIIDDRGRVTGRWASKDFSLTELINCCNFIPATSVFFKRRVLETVGLLDISITPSDYDYWIRVGKVFPIQPLPDFLSEFRIHPGSIGGSAIADRRYPRTGFLVCRRHGGSYFSPRTLDYAKFIVADLCRPLLGPLYPSIRQTIKQALSRLGIYKPA